MKIRSNEESLMRRNDNNVKENMKVMKWKNDNEIMWSNMVKMKKWKRKWNINNEMII